MLTVRNLVKVYKTKGGTEVRALDGVTVDFPETGMVFLLGRSGSGKSTLLNVAGGLDKPDSGEVIVKGKSSEDFTGSDFDSYRNTFVGFVFQEYNILNEFNIEQNIALALQLQGKKNDKEAVNAILERVDLAGMGKRKPNTLSGGQKQRVAIARALIKEPEIIMADEPTGALDSNTGKQVLDTLKKLSETKLVIIVSHDREFAEQYGDRVIELKDGKILTDTTKTYAEPTDVSSNVAAVGGDTVRIKDWSKLTKAEFDGIFAMLKGKSGEVIIASSESDIPAVKRACRITDGGSREYFKDTAPESVKINSYDGTQTKFIKSRLPIGHAIKMGASGLKTKPVRLFFTILISIISFTLFGVLLTMMMYNSVFSISEALKKTGYTTALLEKTYDAERNEYRIDADGNRKLEYSTDTKETDRIGLKELAEMNNNNKNIKFAGVYGRGNHDYVNWLGSLSGNASDGTKVTYPTTAFCGFSDCGEKFMSDNGFVKIAGKYPAEANEIAVSEYVYNQFKDKGYRSSSETERINSPADLIGKEIGVLENQAYGKKPLKIVGIYDVGDYLGKYENILKGTTVDKQSKDYLAQKTECEDEIQYGFQSLAFVSDKFYDEYKSAFNGESFEYIQSRYIYGARMNVNKDNWYDKPIQEYDSVPYFSEETVRNNADKFKIYSLDGNKIDNSKFSPEEDEVYVELRYLMDSAYMLAQSSKLTEIFYDSDGNVFYDKRAGWTKQEKFWTDYAGNVSFEEKPNYALFEFGEIKYVHKNGPSATYEEIYGMYEYKECYADKDGNLTTVRPADDSILEVRYGVYYTDGNGNYSLEKKEDWTQVSGEYYYSESGNLIFISIPEGYYEWAGTYYVNLNDPSEIVGDLLENWRMVDGYYSYADGSLSSVHPEGYSLCENFFVNKETGELSLTYKDGFEFADGFYLDSEGNAVVDSETGYDTKVYGVFINAEGKLSLTKKEGYVFRSQWVYNDTEQKVIFADKRNGYYTNADGEKVSDPASEYTTTQNGNTLWIRYGEHNKEFAEAYERLVRSAGYYGEALGDEVNTEDVALVLDCIKRDRADWAESGYEDRGKLPETLYARNRNNEERELKIKGFYCLSNSGDIPIISSAFVKTFAVVPDEGYSEWVTEYKTDYVAPDDLRYNYIIAKSDSLSSDVYFMLEEKSNSVSYKMYGNSIYDGASMAIEMIELLSLVFLIVGLVMAVLSALMLFNFISASISAKRKEIGVLRAVGARGTDVFKIFFAEAFIIAMICFVISAIAGGVLCFVLNGVFAGAINITVLNYGIVEILLILGVSAVVAVLATILPVYFAAKKPPVESIRAL